jgi:hypothetical protein
MLERKELTSPTIERSRLGMVREAGYMWAIEDSRTPDSRRQTPDAARRWRLRFMVVPDEQLRWLLGSCSIEERNGDIRRYHYRR